MTDRVRTLTVVLDRDFRVDDVELVMDAIKMTKGVSQVLHNDDDVVRSEDHIARNHVFGEVSDGLLAMMKALRAGKKFEVVEK